MTSNALGVLAVVFKCASITGVVTSKALGALAHVFSYVSRTEKKDRDASNVGAKAPKALGTLAVAQRDIQRAQSCAR